MFRLIKNTGNTEYIEQCVKDRKKLGLDMHYISQLIETLENVTSQEVAIEKGKKLGLDEEEITRLELFLSKEDRGDLSEIDLPENMTVGMEIELLSKKNAREYHKIKNEWQIDVDLSLEPDQPGDEDVEIVSPILTGNNEITTQEIRRMCTEIKKLGGYTNESCGGHIHIGADYLTSRQAWINLIELYANSEKLLYIIGNERGTIPREGITQFAYPISSKLEQELNNGEINLAEKANEEEMKAELVSFQEGRNRGINFKNKDNNRDKKNTIEFRIPNGTLSADTWIKNINLFGGIVKAAQEIAVIQAKEEKTRQEKEKLKNFEVIREENNDKRKLEALLVLAIPERSRDIYRERYQINQQLLSNSAIEIPIRTATASQSIQINKSKIRKTVLMGENRILGEEAFKAEQIIERSLEQKKENETKVVDSL